MSLGTPLGGSEWGKAAGRAVPPPQLGQQGWKETCGGRIPWFWQDRLFPCSMSWVLRARASGVQLKHVSDSRTNDQVNG